MGEPTATDSALAGLEHRLARMVTWTLVAILPILLTTIATEFLSQRWDPLLLAQGTLHALVCGVLLVSSRARLKAGITVGYLQFIVFIVLLHYGPSMNVALIFVGSAMLTEVFFGRWWTLTIVACGAAVFAVAAWIHTSGTGYSFYDPAAFDLSNPAVWFRILVNAFVVLIGIALMFGWVFNDLKQHIQRAETALAREREERAEREAAVEDKRKAEVAMAEAQRHEVVARIAASSAHDLNNVLTAILGSAEIAELDAEKPELVREEVAQIQASALRASALTRQLLSFTRQQTTRHQPIHLAETLDMTRSMVRRLLPAHIELRIDLEPGLPAVNADPAQLEQVLLNLCVNARDAMPDGGQLSVSAYRIPGEERVAIEVRDTGEGIPEEIRSKIFEPYFTTKPNGRGTGLGLATVRTIAEQHGGTIDVESEPGVGSTFRILLPAADSSVVRPEETGSIGAYWHEGRALVADDDPAILRVASRTLEGCGFTVSTAINGDRAIELARAHEFDVVIIDAVMPGLSGSRLVTAIEKLSPSSHVICSTAYDAGVFGPSFFAQRERELLPKPYRRKDLIAAVERAMGRDRDGHRPRRPVATKYAD